ncbi:MAG: glucose dehydrogenase [Nocardioides sp.]|nr:glucose dehydrogenase [Nocardioides sp.]
MRTRLGTVLAALVTSATAAAVLPSGTPASAVTPVGAGVAAAAQTAPTAARATPRLRISVRARGLSHAWDAKPIGRGRVLITEREPARLTVAAGSGTRRVRFPTGKVFVSGETGLMGLEIDPGYSSNRRFYTCSGWRTGGGGHDVRVIAWRMNDAATRARMIKPLVTGLPSTSGRHGGCRLLVTDGGALVVGTGDAAVGRNPRSLTSLGGKTLRLQLPSGRPHPANPFAGASNRKKRYVLTYGHRNVQGLAQRRDGSLWSVEHGPDRDDEVNRLRPGGDYGWHPVPGYDESVPMTDQSLPGKQVGARWRSGRPTLATSGSTFVDGRKWGAWNGVLAVAALKAERLVLMRFDRQGRFVRSWAPRQLRRYGRLRTVTQLPNGNLLVCTDGDGGAGKVLLVKPV